MFVNVNPAKMARALQAFVKQSGGDASYSAALEAVAGMCGFDAYRAQKAYAQANAEKDNVVFETVLHAWDKETACEWAQSQAQRRQDPYRLTVEQFGDQLRLSIAPTDVKNLVMDSAGRQVLDVLLEINEGLPCLHVTNDPAGEMLMSVFGHAGGLLVREDEGALERAENANEKLGAHMRDEGWDAYKKNWDAFVVNYDTQRKYADSAATQVE